MRLEGDDGKVTVGCRVEPGTDRQNAIVITAYYTAAASSSLFIKNIIYIIIVYNIII